MSIARVSATTADQDIADLLRRDGCVVLHDLIPGAVVGRVSDDLTRYEEKAEFGEGVFVGARTKIECHGALLMRSREVPGRTTK